MYITVLEGEEELVYQIPEDILLQDIFEPNSLIFHSQLAKQIRGEPITMEE